MLSETTCPETIGKSRPHAIKASNAGKTFLQTFFFFLLASQICFAQWYKQNPLMTSNTLNDVVLIDDNNGWAVGDKGTIIKTTNDGIDWVTQESEITSRLAAVCFTNPNIGWAVGDSGTIIKTTNGGVNWKQQISGVIDNLNDVSFADENKGLVVGNHGRVLRTTDGGNIWTAQQLTNTITLYAVHFINVNTGWIVGDNDSNSYYNSIIRKTTDGGQTWIVQSSPLSTTHQWLKDVHFVDNNNGWIVGHAWLVPDEGVILNTTNGGTTWVSQTSGTNEPLRGIFFTDLNNGWAVGGFYKGILLRTTNGGEFWTKQTLRTRQEFNSVWFRNNSVGVLVGQSGTIINSTDGGNNWFSLPAFCTSNWHEVAFTDANNGVVVGDKGNMMITSNGGVLWLYQISGTKQTLDDVQFIDSYNGWAVGDSGTIIKTTDGGINWTQQTSGTVGQLNGIYFVDANNGWAVGENYVDSSFSLYAIILHTTNGGVNWIQQFNAVIYGNDYRPLGGLKDVCFIDTNTGTAVGGLEGIWNLGFLLRTTDGGTTWVEQYTRMTPSLKGVTFTNTVTGFVVGYSGVDLSFYGEIWYTIDGGSTWSLDSATILGTGVFLDVFFTDFDNGTVVGYFWPWGEQEGVILHTIDAGANWIKQTSGTMNSLNGVFFTDALTGWAVGDNGTILHTTNGGNPVPVELNSFTATANGKEVTLNWSTATELNNQGFEVQRKYGSNDFVTVGSVKGRGTTTSPNNYTFIDKLTDAGKYFYRLKQIDFGGKNEYSQTVEINWSPFTTYKLEQNYPNPFNPTTTIGFGIPEKGNVRLSILNVLGEEIRVLLNEEKEAGYHSIDFNGSDLPSGVYFYQLKSGNFVQTKQMLLLK